MALCNLFELWSLWTWSWKQAQKPLSLVSGIVRSTIEFANEQEMICLNQNDDYTRNISDRVLVVVASLQLDLSVIAVESDSTFEELEISPNL